jgi:hypothetical protein
METVNMAMSSTKTHHEEPGTILTGSVLHLLSTRILPNYSTSLGIHTVKPLRISPNPSLVRSMRCPPRHLYSLLRTFPLRQDLSWTLPLALKDPKALNRQRIQTSPTTFPAMATTVVGGSQSHLRADTMGLP